MMSCHFILTMPVTAVVAAVQLYSTLFSSSMLCLCELQVAAMVPAKVQVILDFAVPGTLQELSPGTLQVKSLLYLI